MKDISINEPKRMLYTKKYNKFSVFRRKYISICNMQYAICNLQSIRYLEFHRIKITSTQTVLMKASK
jgi:hypothetical protein